jgi:NAD(P)-dependent dehydrogenase (short-subunit alcohol dehydrogenase family)
VSGLQGKRVLVTGASRGVGFAVAAAFAAAGAEVVATARNADGLARLKAKIVTAGGRATVIAGDLSTRAGARAVAEKVGEVDALVNNAAVTSATYASILTETDENWDLQFGLNLFGPVALMQALIPGMIRRGGGSVTNISSSGAHRPSPLHAPYSASKGALELVSRAAAIDFGPQGVRVNCIALGLTDTEALREVLTGGVTADDVGRAITPIGRANRVSEVAALCVFLAGDDAAALTGAVIPLDGGVTAGDFQPARKGAGLTT